MIARSGQEAQLDYLALLIERHATGFGTPTAVARQALVRVDDDGTADLKYQPMLCFVARGAKRMLAGNAAITVRRGEMFVGVIDAPVSAVFEAPYRSATLILDEHVLAKLIVEIDEEPGPRETDSGVFRTTDLDAPLLDAVTRWVALNDESHHAGVLSRRIEEEILYRVLTGPLGGVLLSAAGPGNATPVRLVTAHLANNLAKPSSLDELAVVAQCSAATLARQFKRVTGTTPLQFHKQLKLQRARQLLATGSFTAASAAASVGYTSASQFNRDYRRRYGEPPLRHARTLASPPTR